MNRLFGYLSFHGRANRARYWMTAASIFGLTFVCALAGSAPRTILPPLAIVFGLLLLPLFLASLANTARRLHDRNKSAWWLLVFVGVPTLFAGLQELFTLGGGESAAGPAGLMALILLGFSLWGLVEIGILKGTEGPNRFGEDPLAEPVTEVFA